MLNSFRNFLRGLSVNKIGSLGVILVTSSVITFFLFEVARIAGILTNDYIGLITYLLFPVIFMMGLSCIPVGWRMYKRSRGLSTRRLLAEKFNEKDVQEDIWGSKVFKTILILTAANIVILSAAGLRMLHFMDSPHFCGTACHKVMNPEWVTYQSSPHARVQCVQCHVGEGVGALIDSKLNGLRQMFLATFNIYRRPIPTPVHQLRPARETCEKCHWPEKFYGSRMKTLLHFQSDSASTPLYTTLNLKIDTGLKAGIHWHVGSENEIRYCARDDERLHMLWVEVRQADGSWKKFNNTSYSGSPSEREEIRIMDCVDCHNRATHIYQSAEDAVDQTMQNRTISRTLPYVKREALMALNVNYTSHEQAAEGIAHHLLNFYQQVLPAATAEQTDKIAEAIHAVQDIYQRNIHPSMRIEWDSYPSHIGHQGAAGCFRCHTMNLTDSQGQFISNDCALCHSILAHESADAFQFLKPIPAEHPESMIHQYYQDEFLKTSRVDLF